MDFEKSGFGCRCHTTTDCTTDAIGPANIAASAWRRVQSVTKTPIYIAPNGSIFQTIKQIRQFFFVMTGITFCLDNFVEQLDKLPIMHVASEDQVNQIHLDLIRKFQPDFNEIENRSVPKQKVVSI